MKKFLLSWFVASMVLGFTGESVAATLYVDVNAANPVTPFTSWATAATNIQSAVDAAVDGDTVSVTNGHYLLSSEILVTNNITIQSVNGSGSTVVDGGGVTRCFNLTDRDCLISGLTITNGHSADDGGGGGIYCSGISPVVSNCIITGNIAAGTYSIGGGMVQGTANNCTISGNSAKYGGGMCGYPSGCIANNCTISGNSAIAGGGVHSGTLNNCIITGNSAQDGDGGGMAYGTANNCAISWNSAVGNGGGMAYGTANNCTISGNASIARGGGTYVTTATNCIVWYNEGSGEQKNMLDTSIAKSTCSPDVTHGARGNITNAPLLVSSSHIAADSPCIGAGSNLLYSSGTDIDGEPWLNPPSMGCDEYYVTSASGEIYITIGKISGDVFFDSVVDLSSEILGAATIHVWDFGDGTFATNSLGPSHIWEASGSYDVVLTAFNETYLEGVSATQTVQVLTLEDVAIHVSLSGNDSNDGSDWLNAKATIQAGIDALLYEGGLVLVSNGTYAVSSEITVTNNITIKSINGPDATIVDGGGSKRCFNLGSTDCLISGFTISNGYSSSDGGGVYCVSEDPVVSNCIINANSAKYGGGMYFGTAFNCEISNNTAIDDGGGLYYTDVYNSLICSNYSADYASAASHGEVINCTVTENTCGNTGRLLSQIGIVLYGCDIKNSIIYYNPGSRDNNQIRGSSVYHSCLSDAQINGNGNVNAAPEFTFDYHISTNSPCRSAGNAAYIAGVDLDGTAWLIPPSMGCYEVHAPILMTLIGPTNICVGIEGLYQVTVTGAIEELMVAFGDGEVITNHFQFAKTWNSAGNYDVLISGRSVDYPQGISFSQRVSVVNDSIVYVSENGDDSASGSSWANAKASIQAGIDAAAYGGTVLVAEGLYTLNQSIHLSRAIQVVGGSDPSQTIVDAGGNGRVFALSGQGSTLSGMTIRNGYYHIDYPPTPTYGGGIFCDGGSHIITNCMIFGNTVGYGGGGVFGGTIYDSVISGNTVASQNGGGLFGSQAYRCIISGNSAGLRFGGGMYGGYAENCLIANNSSATGGGISGGIAVNCTIVYNTAGSRGGVASSTVKNSIICNNVSDFTGPNNFHNQDSDVYYSCSPDAWHGVDGNITNMPFFVDPESANYRLQSNSLCINWGKNTHVSGITDLDGNLRIVEGYVDMGCYEYQGLIGESDNDGDGMSDAWEQQWFGVNVSPEDNADGDIQSNGDECIAGTDPTDLASYFHVTTATTTAGNPSHIIIDWEAVTSRVYNVLWTPSLLEPFQSLETGIAYPQHSYTDTVHSAEASGYYRAVVMRSDYDADGDGLPNDWEEQYALADASADGDQDGFDNLSEFIAGTDPTNGASYFATANSVAEINGTNCFVVEWISIPDRLYSVQWSTNLVEGFQTLETGIEHPQGSYTDTTHNAESEGFYKVDVRLR